MKTDQKIRYRADGRITIEERIEYYDTIDGRTPLGESELELWAVGDEGCAASYEDNMAPYHVEMQLQDGPVVGNMGGARCYHGWRGTTCDIHCEAHGWRRVEESRPLTRGCGWRVVLGRDLKSNEE